MYSSSLWLFISDQSAFIGTKFWSTDGPLGTLTLTTTPYPVYTGYYGYCLYLTLFGAPSPRLMASQSCYNQWAGLTSFTPASSPATLLLTTELQYYHNSKSLQQDGIHSEFLSQVPITKPHLCALRTGHTCSYTSCTVSTSASRSRLYPIRLFPSPGCCFMIALLLIMCADLQFKHLLLYLDYNCRYPAGE